MSRTLPILCAAGAVAVGLTVWHKLSAGARVPVPADKGKSDLRQPSSDDLTAALRTARRKCDLPALDEVVAQAAEQTRGDGANGDSWRVLAEALLERAQQRSHLRGMKVGEPVQTELPPELLSDLTAGLDAVRQARVLGDSSGALFRIEAGLMSQHITGLVSALQWNSKIDAALTRAGELASQDPQLHVALGLRKLLAPAFLGHDLDGALAHFEFAANSSDDERPAVFAAMATLLQQKRQQAIAWLEQAVARNPANMFARVVLRRVRRGEDDPFGRDVSATEIAAAK